MFTARAELVLARDPISTLRDVPLDPDPLTPIALAMSDLDLGENLEVILDLVPLTPGEQRRWRNKAIKRYEAKQNGSGVGTIGQQIRAELTRGTKYESKPSTPRPGS